jgi:hypothetical protein
MLCCGAFALLAASALGLGRLLKAHRRLVIGLAGLLVAAGPLVALAAGVAADRRAEGDGGWAAAMRIVCGAPVR